MQTDGKGGAGTYLGSDDRRRIFAARPVRFKVAYYWNVVTAYYHGAITWRSCWQALNYPYVALVHRSGSGMVLVCPEALAIEFA